MIGVALDITGLRKLEEQFHQAQKMEAIGRLAAGVAHDFNNLLMVMLTYSDLLLDGLTPGSKEHGQVRQVRMAADRAVALTRQLLSFSRKAPPAPDDIDLSAVVSGVEKLLHRLVSEDVRFVVDLASEPVLVRANAGQIEQVLMNLVVNARDAMPQGGVVTISTRHVHVPTPRDGITAGRHGVLSVSDSGVGMDSATRERIFEPFFTTKPVGSGTGLGLAVVFGVVQQCKGTIVVESEPGHGSTFKVFLPALQPGTSMAPPPAGAARLPRGAETVMVVEDDAFLLQVLAHTLETCGYRVIKAADAGVAFAALDENPGPLHLLLTDVVLPSESGRELAVRVRQRHPLCKLILLTGYSDEDVVRHGGTLRPGEIFLQKPVSPTMLATRVREVLDGARRAEADAESG